MLAYIVCIDIGKAGWRSSHIDATSVISVVCFYTEVQ